MPKGKFSQRRSPRLQGYDYAQAGAYFVTVCTHKRLPFFGEVCDQRMHLSWLGRLVQRELEQLARRWADAVTLDQHVVMPNHIHAILVLHEINQTTLGHIVGNFKSGVTRKAWRMNLIEDSEPVWQARFHDHIIRNETSLNYIRRYIHDNPARWEQDTFYE